MMTVMPTSKGQTVIVVLLLLAVALTVGLSIISRSVVEVDVATTQDEAARALAAAEAGIEAALGSTVAYGSPVQLPTTGASYTVQSAVVGAGSSFTFPNGFTAGDSATLWLSGHDAAGRFTPGQNDVYNGTTLKICWGQNVAANSSSAPALETAFFYHSGGQTRVSRAASDPNSGRRGQNLFQALSGDTSGCPASSNAFATSLSLPSGTPLLVRLRLLYNGEVAHRLGAVAASGTTFPSQGQILTSTGQAGTANREVTVTQLYSDLPPQFDSAVFSGTSLAK